MGSGGTCNAAACPKGNDVMCRIVLLSFFLRCGKVGISLSLECRRGTGACAMRQCAPTTSMLCIAFYFFIFLHRCGKVGISLGLEHCRGAGAHAMRQCAPTATTQCVAFNFFCAAVARWAHHLGLSIVELGYVQHGNVP